MIFIIIYTAGGKSCPLGNLKVQILQVGNCNKNIIFQRDKHNNFKLMFNKHNLSTCFILFHQKTLANDCWADFSLFVVKPRFRCLLPELLIDRTKISISNVQRHVVNEINECQSGSSASRFSESWNIKLNPATELVLSICGAKHWSNRTKTSTSSGWKTQIHKFKGTTNCWFVVQCSIFFNLLFNVQDGRRRSAFRQYSGTYHVEQIYHS